MDIIKVDVPTFLRLLELAREEIKQDTDLHDVAEKVAELSRDHVVTMADYNNIIEFMKQQGSTDELDRIRTLGGL
jgi:hypothetical protein